MDRMHIKDIQVRCIIGTRPNERVSKQELLLNIELGCDLRPAGRSDRLEDTVNYSQLTDRIVEMAEKSSFFLIERLAEESARICLEDPGVQEVTVTIDKPKALERARSAAVSVHRAR